jgi:hypothetical protein
VRRCYVCGGLVSGSGAVEITRPCTRKVRGQFLARMHAWLVCSLDCAFNLGERYGVGSLEYEPGVHQVDKAVRS